MDSTVKQSLLWRSKLNHVDMFKSRVKRAVLTDCEVSECVVIGTEFKGDAVKVWGLEAWEVGGEGWGGGGCF